jgi:PiT family inorganic phosphate transporter
MTILYIILIAIFFGWWMSTTDYAYNVSGLVSTRYFSMYSILGLSFLGLLLGGIISYYFYGSALSEKIKLTTPVLSLVLVFSAFITILFFQKISKLSSMVYALYGVIIGWDYFNESYFNLLVLFKNIIIWAIAPIFTSIIAYYLTFLYKKYILNTNIHYIKMHFYLKWAIIIVAGVFFFLWGINNGVLLAFLESTIKTDLYLALDGTSYSSLYLVYFVSLFIIAVVTFYNTKRKIAVFSENNFIPNSETAFIVIFSASVVLFIFSLPFFFIPISTPQLIFGAILGNAYHNRNVEIRKEEFAKWFLTLIAVPFVAIGLSYVLLHLVNIQFINEQKPVLPRDSAIQIINLATPIVLFSIIVLLSGALFYIIKQNKQKIKAQKEALIHQENLFNNQKSLSVMEVKTVLLENESLNTKLELKRQELTNIALNISEQKLFLENIHQELKKINEVGFLEEKNKKIDELTKLIYQKMSFSQEIESFYAQIETLHKDFNIRLTEHHPILTENDKRLVTLLRLGFSSKHISSLTNISPKSVEIARYRLRTKLGLSHDQNLIAYLKTI